MKNKFFQCKFIGIRFTNELTEKELIIMQKNPNELYCTAIAKAVKLNKIMVIDTRRHKCAGGNYFVGNQNYPLKKIADTYINKESIFPSRNNLTPFLKKTGRNPIKSRYIIFEPITKLSPNKKTKVIITVTTPNIVSGIIGLSAYFSTHSPDIIPAASTCTAIFRPLIKPKSIHINLIDYFDREYQCKGLYNKNDLIIGMTPKLFNSLIKTYPKSCHGGKKPKGIRAETTENACKE
jgi:uncharacterized protein (DUF169 family)